MQVAFAADVLPTGPDGRPKDPTRDTLVFGWSGTITGIVVPLAGGAIFNMVRHMYVAVLIWHDYTSSAHVVTMIASRLPYHITSRMGRGGRGLRPTTTCLFGP